MQIVHFTPPQIAKFFNVNETTVKRWIQSGKLPANKTIGGHYRVSKTQMTTFLNSNKGKIRESYVLNRILSNKSSIKFNWKEYYDKLLENDSYYASKIISKMYLNGKGLSEIFDKVIIPTLKHIGNEWSEGKIDVVHEHRMSFQISQHISELSFYVKETKKKELPEVILACVPGNTHVLPMLIGDLIFKKYNFRREVLGINVSIEQLEKAINSNNKLRIVCISNTYSTLDNNEYLLRIISLAKIHNFNIILIGEGWNSHKLSNTNQSLINHITSLSSLERYLKNL